MGLTTVDTVLDADRLLDLFVHRIVIGNDIDRVVEQVRVGTEAAEGRVRIRVVRHFAGPAGCAMVRPAIGLPERQTSWWRC